MNDEIEVDGLFAKTGAIMTAEEQYKQHKDKLKLVLVELRESARNYFKETVNKLFEAYPVLKSFAWTQYTPYWCDGDTCEFGINGLCELNGGPVPSFSTWDRTTGKSKPKNDPLSKAAFAANMLVESIDSSDMEAMFGDHVKVMVTRDGITTQEYDHE